MAQESIKSKPALIVIGGSSGSLDAVMQFLPLIHKSFTIPILLIMHRNNQSDSALVELLSKKTKLKVKEADDKDVLKPGFLYIAPADYHVLLEAEGILSLDASEKVHYCRPSIDVSFISASYAFKENTVGILLSGANADGVNGLEQLHNSKSVTIVQNPEEALVDYMPAQAVAAGVADKIFSCRQIAEYLNEL